MKKITVAASKPLVITVNNKKLFLTGSNTVAVCGTFSLSLSTDVVEVVGLVAARLLDKESDVCGEFVDDSVLLGVFSFVVLVGVELDGVEPDGDGLVGDDPFGVDVPPELALSLSWIGIEKSWSIRTLL